jgi:ABC-type glycerol-3-phosphate transport system permease component
VSVETPSHDVTTEQPERAAVSRPRSTGRIGAFIALVVGSFVFAYPLLWMIATSLRTRGGIAAAGISLWPVQWKFANYVDGLTAFDFWRYLANSVISTLVPVVLTVAVSSLVGFAFARIRPAEPGYCSPSSSAPCRCRPR